MDSLTRSFVFFSLAQLLQTASAFTFAPTGQTVELDGVPYYVPPAPVATLPTSQRSLHKAAEAAGGLVPLTVISTTSLGYSSSDFAATLSGFTASDDVWSEGFLEGTPHLLFSSVSPDDCVTAIAMRRRNYGGIIEAQVLDLLCLYSCR